MKKKINGGFIIVKVIIPNGIPKIILVQRDNNLKWEVPGGGVEDSESYKETAIREFFEETGMSVESFDERIVRTSDFKLRDESSVVTFLLEISSSEYDKINNGKIESEQICGLFEFREMEEMWNSFKEHKNPEKNDVMGWGSFKRVLVSQYKVETDSEYLEDNVTVSVKYGPS